MKGSVITTRIVGVLLVLMMILTLVMVPGHSRVIAASDGGAVVDLVLLPPTQTVNVDDTFDVTIEARCHGQEITGVAAFLDFDPTYLEVVSITPGATLDVTLWNTYDNAAGTADYTAGKLTPPFPSGTFDVAVVTFRAKAGVDSTAISFHRDSPRLTDADFGGTSKLDEAIGATVTIIGVPPLQHTLTMAVIGNGTTTPAVGAHIYAANTVVTITATPDAGWQFVNWTGDVADANSPTTTVTMDADKTVTASFTVMPIKINEFVSNPADDQVEWIELYNPTGSEVDLTGWTIEDNTGSTYGGGGGDTSLDGKLIPAGGYLVLVKGVDFTFILTNPGDVIILKSGVTEVDRVAYGNFDDGDTADNAPAPGEGESSARFPNGVDTGVDRNDFVVFTVPTPGAANQVTVAPTVVTAAATGVTANTATLNGNLTDMGTAASVQVSFEWGITSGALDKVTDPQTMTATGAFSAAITDLQLDTTYYFRARATADGVTVYGDELSFTTGKVLPGDATGDGNINALDITKVVRIIVGLDHPTPGADANQDGNINALDITKVERIIAGLD